MQKVLILDLGGPYSKLVARRVRECHVYCEVKSARGMTVDAVRAFEPIGIILTGSAECGATARNGELVRQVLTLGIPVLGICYGSQLMAVQAGGTVRAASAREMQAHRRTLTKLDNTDILFADSNADAITWMCQGDQITALPEGFAVTASTASCPIAAYSCPEKGLYGVQFHPEVAHTNGGTQMINSFLENVCGAEGDWRMEEYARNAIRQLREQIGSRRVLLALSGGVDSSVAAALLNRAVGEQLTCIFVDHGMLRKDEGDQVEAFFSRMDMQFVRVNAADRFISRLEGVTDPQQKRDIIGEEFVRVFEAEAKKLGEVDFLAQGTIYPDVMESGMIYADVIRSPHKTGIYPDHIEFKALLEPLRMLLKDEVRELGRTIGLPEEMVSRQPFPGPGLAIRIIGQITREKIAILQDADLIFREALERAHLNSQIGQYFAVLTDTRTVDITCDDRSYRYTLALRAVTTDDYFTAKWARLPYELLDHISEQIIRQVPGINRIVYDITSKPPATIEWE